MVSRARFRTLGRTVKGHGRFSLFWVRMLRLFLMRRSLSSTMSLNESGRTS